MDWGKGVGRRGGKGVNRVSEESGGDWKVKPQVKILSANIPTRGSMLGRGIA